jgi:signal transduction histidine kinase
MVEPVLKLFQGRLSNSDITVKTRYTSRTAVLCLENEIRQVLSNLIGNAIDAMRTGGRLLVRSNDVTDESGRVSGLRITVADTGHGMSHEARRRIFEPFFTTKDLNGTGLGLWISSEIVERHRGTIRVRSRQGPGPSGTVFWLVLPLGGD